MPVSEVIAGGPFCAVMPLHLNDHNIEGQQASQPHCRFRFRLPLTLAQVSILWDYLDYGNFRLSFLIDDVISERQRTHAISRNESNLSN